VHLHETCRSYGARNFLIYSTGYKHDAPMVLESSQRLDADGAQRRGYSIRIFLRSF